MTRTRLKTGEKHFFLSNKKGLIAPFCYLKSFIGITFPPLW